MQTQTEITLRPSRLPDWVRAFFSSADWADHDGVCLRPALATSHGIAPAALTLCQQTHGAGVALVAPQQVGRGAQSNATRLPNADALITAEPHAALCILTADCVPILLCDKVQRVVAAIHSGWRGTVTNIVQATVDQMVSQFGTDPINVVAAVGPHIHVGSYTVGPEVAEALGAEHTEIDALGRLHANLTSAVVCQLKSCGIPDIEVVGPDTGAIGSLWPSYRRERTVRRLASVIMLQ